MITQKEFDKYIRSIGGLENGYTAWPNKYGSCDYEWLSKIRFYSFSFLHFIKVPDRSNPFRSKRYYISCPNGWMELVKNLIQELIKNGWNKELCDCKEKFGGLRFYINGASKECHDIISKYENLSYETCERCGEPGEPNDTGWITTLCDGCRNKNK